MARKRNARLPRTQGQAVLARGSAQSRFSSDTVCCAALAAQAFRRLHLRNAVSAASDIPLLPEAQIKEINNLTGLVKRRLRGRWPVKIRGRVKGAIPWGRGDGVSEIVPNT